MFFCGNIFGICGLFTDVAYEAVSEISEFFTDLEISADMEHFSFLGASDVAYTSFVIFCFQQMNKHTFSFAFYC